MRPRRNNLACERNAAYSSEDSPKLKVQLQYRGSSPITGAPPVVVGKSMPRVIRSFTNLSVARTDSVPHNCGDAF